MPEWKHLTDEDVLEKICGLDLAEYKIVDGVVKFDPDQIGRYYFIRNYANVPYIIINFVYDRLENIRSEYCNLIIFEMYQKEIELLTEYATSTTWFNCIR